MSPTKETSIKINEVTKISKKIIDIFNQLEKMEIDNNYQKEVLKKMVFEIKELVEIEKQLYNEIALDEEFDLLVKESIRRQDKIERKYGISGSTQKRFITKLVSYFRSENDEFDYNLLIKYPEFINLDIPKELKYSELISFINEEIYTKYLKKINENIKNVKYRTIRENLIELKYKDLKTVTTTNSTFVKTFSSRRNEAKLSSVLYKYKISIRKYGDFMSDYIYDFFKMFFIENLKIEDDCLYEKKKWIEIVDKLMLAEIMIGMADYFTIDRIERTFYEMFYHIAIKNDIKNKEIAELIANLFERESYEPRKLKNKSIF